MARKKTSSSTRQAVRSVTGEKVVSEVADSVDINNPKHFFFASDYKEPVLCRAVVAGINKNGKPGVIHFTFPTVDQVDTMVLAVDRQAQVAAALQLLADCLKNPDGTPAFESVEELRQHMSMKWVLLFANAIVSDTSVEVEKNG